MTDPRHIIYKVCIFQKILLLLQATPTPTPTPAPTPTKNYIASQQCSILGEIALDCGLKPSFMVLAAKIC